MIHLIFRFHSLTRSGFELLVRRNTTSGDNDRLMFNLTLTLTLTLTQPDPDPDPALHLILILILTLTLTQTQPCT